MKRSPRSDVLVVDAEPITRFGLVALLRSHGQLRVVGEAETLRTARELCAKLKPHVVVIDPAMEGSEGLAFLKELPRWAPRAHIVAFSAQEDAGYVQRAFCFGACGYISRRDPVPALIAAVVGAVSGERHVGPRIEKVLLDELAAGGVEFRQGAAARLSAREKQVYRLVGEGRQTREMAETLGVSVKTIDSHQHRIKTKLGLRSCAELRRCAAAALEPTPASHKQNGRRARRAAKAK